MIVGKELKENKKCSVVNLKKSTGKVKECQKKCTKKQGKGCKTQPPGHMRVKERKSKLGKCTWKVGKSVLGRSEKSHQESQQKGVKKAHKK